MARSISAAARTALFARETSAVMVVLLTVEHEDLEETIYIAANTEDVMSRGTLFVAHPFEITLPSDEAGRPGSATLTVDIVQRDILAAIGRVGTPPDATLEFVLASTPDVVEMVVRCAIHGISLQPGADRMVCQLAYEDRLNEMHPKDAYTPSLFPGLF